MMFYFNVYGRKVDIDKEGVDLPDIHAARISALELATDIMKDEVARADAGVDWEMEVKDETGNTVFSGEMRSYIR